MLSGYMGKFVFLKILFSFVLAASCAERKNETTLFGASQHCLDKDSDKKECLAKSKKECVRFCEGKLSRERKKWQCEVQDKVELRACEVWVKRDGFDVEEKDEDKKDEDKKDEDKKDEDKKDEDKKDEDKKDEDEKDEDKKDEDNDNDSQTSTKESNKKDKTLGVVIANTSAKVKEGSNVSIKSGAKEGNYEILGLGGSGGAMKDGDIKDLEKQGFQYIGGAKDSERDKNAYLFYRKKKSEHGSVKIRKFANKVMFINLEKTSSQLSKLGVNLDKEGSVKRGKGSFDGGQSVDGLSFVTTDDGVKDVKCDAKEVWAADGSTKGDGGFMIFGGCKFKADRNDSRGGRQLYYVSFD